MLGPTSNADDTPGWYTRVPKIHVETRRLSTHECLMLLGYTVAG